LHQETPNQEINHPLPQILPKKYNSDKNSIPKSGYHHHFKPMNPETNLAEFSSG
jgi:hypothetical protein